jgi:trans-2,3-dihydro-3-hydroxyanthranilate isomerase
MNQTKFLVVNSFAETVFGGNPAAVFVKAEEIEPLLMQMIARQLNLVETVFILPPQGPDHDFYFRYFTPTEELPIAGHPTVAAILALIEERRIDSVSKKECRIKTGAGIKQIRIDSNSHGPLVMMEQPAPEFLPVVSDWKSVANVFGLLEEDLLLDLPVQPVNTGLGHLIVPVKSLEALMRVERKIAPLKKLCGDLGIREAQIFAFQTHDPEKTLHTRNICPREGLEDPGCGVGNGALGAYLLKHHYLNKIDIALKAEQGLVVNMPCVIEIFASRIADDIQVAVGGNGKIMIKGSFFLE